MSVTFAVLALPFFALAARLEFYGPRHGSSPWFRGALGAWWLSLSALAVVTAVLEWLE